MGDWKESIVVVELSRTCDADMVPMHRLSAIPCNGPKLVVCRLLLHRRCLFSQVFLAFHAKKLSICGAAERAAKSSCNGCGNARRKFNEW